jgi:hypothetical protein
MALTLMWWLENRVERHGTEYWNGQPATPSAVRPIPFTGHPRTVAISYFLTDGWNITKAFRPYNNIVRVFINILPRAPLDIHESVARMQRDGTGRA